jgi:exosortase
MDQISPGFKSRPRVSSAFVERLGTGWFLAFGAVGLVWVLLFKSLVSEWEVNPQYSYGYAVPLLGALVLWRRWQQRPRRSDAQLRFSVLFGGLLLLLFFPLRMLGEANPEWRLLYWIGGIQAVGLSLCLFYALGGWRWVRCFAPPLLFMLVAVPWPMELEQTAVQGLMRLVAAMTVVVANTIGIPALQHGNVIEVGTGFVGIDEACSGVRSLQAALMLSLFLGEINWFSWTRRFVLLIGSLLLVLVANLGRTTFLVWAAATHGMHEMETWHDTAGFLVMLVVLPSLLGLGFLLRREKPGSAISKDDLTATNPTMIPRWVGLGIISWIVIVEAGTEAWYRVHERNLVPNVRWSATWPIEAPGFQRTAIPQNSLAILRCSDSESASWQDDNGDHWSAFVLNWNPGRNSTQLARGHRPDICFPAAGATLANKFGKVVVSAGDFEMPFTYDTFEQGGSLLHVFYCLWPDHISPGTNLQKSDGSRDGRIRAALNGERNLGQQILEIVIRGPENSDEAIRLLQDQLPRLVRKD